MALQIKADSEAKTTLEIKPVPMLDLKAQYLPIKDEIKTSLKEIIESGRFVLGQNVESFEREIASYHKVSNAIGLASGTDALHLTLDALDIKAGDEVITTPFTFIASAEAIAYVGAKPVFVDIDRRTFNMDSSKIEEKITEKTRAILVVHLFGLPADMNKIMDIAGRHNLLVIEDCAQAFGAKYYNKPIGSIGNCGCFSFYPSKNLGAFGDGGMMITDNREIFDKVKLLRNHGTVSAYKHDFLGYNSRLDEIQAAILRIKLKRIDDYNQKRRDIAKLYTSLLSNFVECPIEIENTTHVYHQYTIRSSDRDSVQKALKDNQIASVVYYPISLHMQKAFDYLGHDSSDFPEALSASQEVLSLPVYPELEREKVEHIAEVILKAARG
jgi:dTDP-4-amino-4,6-dideoxygalactose transaminase